MLTKQNRLIASIIGTAFGILLLTAILARENWIFVIIAMAVLIVVIGVIGIVVSLLDDEFHPIKFKKFSRKNKKPADKEPVDCESVFETPHEVTVEPCVAEDTGVSVETADFTAVHEDNETVVPFVSDDED